MPKYKSYYKPKIKHQEKCPNCNNLFYTFFRKKIVNCPDCRDIVRGKYDRAYSKKHHSKKYCISIKKYNEITKECIVCGFTPKVYLHHKDFNRNNNIESNFVGVCHDCHIGIHVVGKTLEELISSRANGIT